MADSSSAFFMHALYCCSRLKRFTEKRWVFFCERFLLGTYIHGMPLKTDGSDDDVWMFWVSLHARELYLPSSFPFSLCLQRLEIDSQDMAATTTAANSTLVFSHWLLVCLDLECFHVLRVLLHALLFYHNRCSRREVCFQSVFSTTVL